MNNIVAFVVIRINSKRLTGNHCKAITFTTGLRVS